MQIQIPTPCHERWQDMNPTERGAFCLACQTEVQDFTKMSDAEIRQYFQKTAGKTCGRFRADQLDRPIALEPKRGFSFGKFWLGLGLFLGWASRAEAQERHLTGDTIVIERKKLEEIPQKKTPPQDSTFLLEGYVMDEKGERLPGAPVFLKNTMKGTTTSIDGDFSLSVPIPATVVFQYLGFKSQEITLSEKPLQPLSVRLEYDERTCTGELIVSRPNIWQRFKNLFRRRR
jgi:hypothetical protein